MAFSFLLKKKKYFFSFYILLCATKGTNFFPLAQPSTALLCQIWYFSAQGERLQVINLPGNFSLQTFFRFAARGAVASPNAAPALGVWAGWAGADPCTAVGLTPPCSCNLSPWAASPAAALLPGALQHGALSESSSGVKISWFMSRINLDYH